MIGVHASHSPVPSSNFGPNVIYSYEPEAFHQYHQTDDAKYIKADNCHIHTVYRHAATPYLSYITQRADIHYILKQ
jgi:hypothetical protein